MCVSLCLFFLCYWLAVFLFFNGFELLNGKMVLMLWRRKCLLLFLCFCLVQISLSVLEINWCSDDGVCFVDGFGLFRIGWRRWLLALQYNKINTKCLCVFLFIGKVGVCLGVSWNFGRGVCCMLRMYTLY